MSLALSIVALLVSIVALINSLYVGRMIDKEIRRIEKATEGWNQLIGCRMVTSDGEKSNMVIKGFK